MGKVTRYVAVDSNTCDVCGYDYGDDEARAEKCARQGIPPTNFTVGGTVYPYLPENPVQILEMRIDYEPIYPIVQHLWEYLIPNKDGTQNIWVLEESLNKGLLICRICRLEHQTQKKARECEQTPAPDYKYEVGQTVTYMGKPCPVINRYPSIVEHVPQYSIQTARQLSAYVDEHFVHPYNERL